jgi:SAM-dependent methyltransferase
MKESDNTAISEFDRFTYPASSTSIDRYVIANSWTKGKKVLDAATGQGYGAGILLSLGAKSVVGIDTDEHAVEVANNLLQSPKAQFKVCDIFNLSDSFEEDEFEVCVSLETFEHLPPERIEEYLQSLKKVTSETIIISTPQRKEKEWEYKGGTHLKEYSADEFQEIITTNFPKCEIGGFGIIEVPLRTNIPNLQVQWGSSVTANLKDSVVMVAVIELQNTEDE